MSIADRLRSESASVRADPAPGFADRIKAAVRAAPPERAAPPPLVFPWRPLLAAAAVVAIAVAIAWPAPAPPAPPAVAASPVPAAAQPLGSLPVPPSLDALVAAVPAKGPLGGEMDALGGDLAAAARVVRAAVPF